tara:strand:- start:756 stop:1025 length:270 start_codon:yes stop_codon:yes gene_type:complete
MERRNSVEVGKSRDGYPLYRHQLINDDNTNYLLKAQSYSSGSLKSLEQLKHEQYKRNQPEAYNRDRNEMIRQMVSMKNVALPITNIIIL